MDFDNYLVEEIFRIQSSCYSIIDALKDKKISKDVAFEILSNLRASAVNAFNKRCELYDANHLDYTSIEEAKNSFLDTLDKAVYSITNQEIVVDEETEKMTNILLS